MSPQLVQTVRARAEGRCEYCHLREEFAETPFQVDHIIAQKHGGPADPDNLAWACFYCNNYKGPNIAGIDPVTGEITRLLHPRRDRWHEHFQLQDGAFIGLTAIGRATVRVLNMNMPEAVALRQLLNQRD